MALADAINSSGNPGVINWLIVKKLNPDNPGLAAIIQKCWRSTLRSMGIGIFFAPLVHFLIERSSSRTAGIEKAKMLQSIADQKAHFTTL